MIGGSKHLLSYLHLRWVSNTFTKLCPRNGASLPLDRSHSPQIFSFFAYLWCVTLNFFLLKIVESKGSLKNWMKIKQSFHCGTMNCRNSSLKTGRSCHRTARKSHNVIPPRFECIVGLHSATHFSIPKVECLCARKRLSDSKSLTSPVLLTTNRVQPLIQSFWQIAQHYPQ